MKTHRITTAALTALALTLAACERGPVAPDMDVDELGALFSAAGSPATRGGAVTAPDDRGPTTGTGGSSGGSVFAVLNSQIDGFAGIYRAGMCSVVLMLAGDVDADEAVRIAAAVLNPRVARSCPSGADIAAQRAEWDWNQLHRFLSIAAPLAGSDGVFAVKLDIPLNALVIAVDSAETARRTAAALGEQGVPEGALHFRIRGAGGMTR